MVHKEALVISGLKKYFGHVKANDGIDLVVRTGTIHAIVGENGAGKSTLMNSLFGLHQPDSGEIYLWGEKVLFSSPLQALAHGIGMVHQHFMLVEALSVLENIILGAEPGKGILLNYKNSRKTVEEICHKYGLELDLDALVENVPVGIQQRIEIVKVLYRGARLIILDEPTAVLIPQEIDRMFEILREFKRDGCTVIFITHKLHEVMALADDVTVIRDGRTVGHWPISQVNEKILARQMVGREVVLDLVKEETKPSELILQVQGLQTEQVNGDQSAEDLSFNIRAGEILGIVGVAGNGQDALIEGILGLRKVEKGEILYLGEAINGVNTSHLRQKGISCISADRLKTGLVREFSVRENAILGYQKSKEFVSKLLFHKKKINHYAQQIIKEFQIKTPSLDALITQLSGGNQQKLIIGRELHANPKLIIAVQPTRGVDIGAIEFIYQVLLECRRKNAAILLISNELEEVLSLSDRVAVLYQGRFMGSNAPNRLTKESIGLMMAGVRTEGEGEPV
ncbi:ABC transporter ATP-binding protein [Desulfosporosinus sp. FKB]|uniref:ABC transporter ATP-binding protein n=1 Tax=Desulfosporosinus sp. FKB TaxID=1969835 RepID=UPI000B49FDB0|nr:ABC transporter ATP-binding protein [Desulfosporosinus sp. FKB]